MMKYKYLPIVIILTLIFISISCTKKPNKNEVWINGEIIGNSYSRLIIEELTPDGIQKIDSASIINNKFKVKIKLEETSFYFLRFSDKNFISLILEPGSIVSLVASADSLGYPTSLTGSPESNLLLELNHNLDKCYHITDSLSKIFKEYQNTAEFDSIKPILDSAYSRMFINHKTWLIRYIDKHTNSLTAIVAFYQTLGRRTFFNSQEDLSTMQKIDESLMKLFPKSKHVIKFHSLFLEKKINADNQAKVDSMLTAGNVIPNIILPNSLDKPVNVNQIQARQKLIFFWDIKSFVDNPDLAKLNNLSPSIKLVAVALEDNRESWLSFVGKELKRAIHIVDNHGITGEIGQLFNITTSNIPYYVLVDVNNKVIAHGKNLKDVIVAK